MSKQNFKIPEYQEVKEQECRAARAYDVRVGTKLALLPGIELSFIERNGANRKIITALQESSDGFLVVAGDADRFGFTIDGETPKDCATFLFHDEVSYFYVVEESKQEELISTHALDDVELYHHLRREFGEPDCNKIIKIVKDYLI